MTEDHTQTKEYKKAFRNYLKTKQPHTADQTAFRTQEKKYKSRFPNPPLSDLVDVWKVDPELKEKSDIGGRWVTADPISHLPISVKTSRSSARAWTLPNHPGLIILPGLISEEEQRALIRSSLVQQARSPNETNLDTHYVIPEDGIWSRCRAAPSSAIGSEAFIHPRASPISGSGFRSVTPTRRTLVNNEPASTTTLSSPSPLAPPTPSPSATLLPPLALLPKLRWANIGRSYHWDSKSYDFSKRLAPFPQDIKLTCKSAVQTVDWKDVWGQAEKTCKEVMNAKDWGEDGINWESWSDHYEPDAGIVNFYQLKDTLMGHVDRSELSSTTPLVSISLGNACVFLIGGLTRDEEPTPILLRSGDVIIMSGPMCRRSFHGVPRILEDTIPKHLSVDAVLEDHEWSSFAEYMENTRININVRQVFPRGFVVPDLVPQEI